MLSYAWVAAYSTGLVSVVCAVIAWRTTRDAADGFFALFVGIFLANTLPISAYAFFPEEIGAFSPVVFLLIVLGLAVSVTLPLYSSARNGLPWMSLVWKVTGVGALLIAGFAIAVFLTADPRWLTTVERVVQVFISTVIVVAIVPFVRKHHVDVGTVPPKAARLAGFITIGFAAALLLPLVLEFWGLGLHLDPLLLYLGFYTALSVRFILLSVPRLRTSKAQTQARREVGFERHGVSPREREVYDLLAKGYTYKEIGRLLGISLPTVKTHVDHLYKKTQTGNRVELLNEIEGQ